MEFYLGIDFGTTNSVIASGRIDAITGRISPEVLPIKIQGNPAAQQIIPSVAMYELNKRQCKGVGIAAKKNLLNVNSFSKEIFSVKSVKLQLGKDQVINANWLKPEEVASDILLFLKSSFERKFNLPPVKNVSIGIPASFPLDMCEKTVLAGKLAGFTEVNLIPEPQAALLDFIHNQSKFASVSQLIDFTQPKNVMVFDLGGGTLDVTIVQVSLKEQISNVGKYKSEISYNALGLSRFSDLGGDVFDSLLMENIVEELANQTGFNVFDIPNHGDRQKVIAMLNEFAEDTKQSLTDEVINMIDFQKLDTFDAMDKAYHDIAIPDIPLQGGSLRFAHTLSYIDYVQIIKPLLAFDLTLEDFNNPAKLDKLLLDESSKNIIIPIFDALYQAKMTLGYTPDVDLVLLNGGMSRIHVIKERIKRLFNHDNIYEIDDPDLSVARGAVIHNYNLVHNLGKSSNIIAESIWLEGGGGSFFELIPSGTKYPTSKPILFQQVLKIPRDNIQHINLPLYRGINGTKSPIAERVIQFREKSTFIKKGDTLDIQVEIDQNRTLKFEACLHNNPNIRFDVNLSI